MTLLPGSSPSSQCGKPSVLVMSELLKPATGSQVFNDSTWEEAFGDSRASLDELKPAVMEEGRADAECFIETELNEPVFGHLHSLPAPTVLPYSSGDGAESSGEEMVNAEATTNQNDNHPFLFKNLSPYCSEMNLLPENDVDAYSDQQHVPKRMRITPNECSTAEEDDAGCHFVKKDLYL
ncbi:hypothetical protein M569_03803 [Genlisea aurea]|uniref:Uncharacterized protein n=1 Tax=Genlisea aurea TaxID=192259 RepID=S8E5A5_9LAMI|nr:hypothetical protein M569_03803 [Genlisea aurea]